MMFEGILLPVFLLVALTFAEWFRVSGRGLAGRTAAMTEAGPRDAALQLDVLFYVLIAFALPLRRADLVMVLLAWVFVVVRLLGSGFVPIPTGSSRIGFAAALVLLAMWVYFALRLLTLL